MPDQEKKLCDACHEREATYHRMISYPEGEQVRQLCAVCFDLLASPDELASQKHIEESIKRGKCRYCGEPATGGSGWSSHVGDEQLHLWCEPCRQDLVEFGSRPENRLPDDVPEDEPAMEELSRRLAERARRKEDYMRQRISKRRSKQ